MGIGDEIMVTGEIKRRAGATTRRFAVRNPRKNLIRWDAIWEGNPRIARPGEPHDEVIDNAGGCRPYIVAKGDRAWVWRAYAPEPGEIFLTAAEREFGERARGAIIISPPLKPSAPINKAWPYWQRLVDQSPDLPWLQVGPPSDQRLARVPFLTTLTFRAAVGALSVARAAVFQEGGLHHAAAAVGLPAVVIFGGYISPRVTGYAAHRNLFRETGDRPLGCGMRGACGHCFKAMQSFAARDVRAELEVILKQPRSSDV